MTDKFKALIVDQHDGQPRAAVQSLGPDSLPKEDVLVSVAYSSLNFKDGLAVTGKAKVLRRLPMVPGIDLAGTVVESASAGFTAGDKVLINGYEIGEKHWGGYTQLNRVKAGWLVPLPQGLSLKQAMAIGTAGYTAMLSVMALEEHGLSPKDQREVVVTGASGGVGSMAVALLANLGYNVTTSTGSPQAHDYLRQLGARNFVDRELLADSFKRPLESERWAGAVDAVGGSTLDGLLKTMGRGGSIAISGNTGGIAVATNVLPFILRGVNVLGIDSNLCPHPRRVTAWKRLAQLLAPEQIGLMTAREATLEEIPALSEEILQGKIRGRVVVKVSEQPNN